MSQSPHTLFLNAKTYPERQPARLAPSLLVETVPTAVKGETYRSDF
jgi:hypothetical protein